MWIEIIKIFGLASILVGAVAWCIKELTKYFLDQNIEIHKKTLELEYEKNSINYREKIELYKEISKPIIKLIVAIEHEQKITQEFVSGAEQWNALNEFIGRDDYLSENRGQHAERNGARMPFEKVVRYVL